MFWERYVSEHKPWYVHLLAALGEPDIAGECGVHAGLLLEEQETEPITTHVQSNLDLT